MSVYLEADFVAVDIVVEVGAVVAAAAAADLERSLTESGDFRPWIRHSNWWPF